MREGGRERSREGRREGGGIEGGRERGREGGLDGGKCAVYMYIPESDHMAAEAASPPGSDHQHLHLIIALHSGRWPESTLGTGPLEAWGKPHTHTHWIA